MEIIKPKGTQDYYGIDQWKLDTIINLIEQQAIVSGFSKVTFPMFENSELFKITSGWFSDIVTKQMYEFTDKGERLLVLRPEGTASCARMAIENKLIEPQSKLQRLYYYGSMFRYERPQKGRYREFFQFGLEIYHDSQLYTEIELIKFAFDVLELLKIKQFKLLINFIGDIETRKKYSTILKEYFQNNFDKLSSDSKLRLEKNVFRILDSKNEQDQELLTNVPKISDYLNSQAKAHFSNVQTILKNLGIPFSVDFKLVRGLDYYNDLVFEFVSTDEQITGNQLAFIGGGRYDNLISILTNNNKQCYALGLAIGIERLVSLAETYFKQLKPPKIDYLICTDDVALNSKLFKVAAHFKSLNQIVLLDFQPITMKKKIEKAQKQQIEKIVIVNNMWKSNIITIKDLKINTTKQVEFIFE